MLCKVPSFSCGTLPQLSRPWHSVAFVFASVVVFVQPRWFRGKHYRQRLGITAYKCTNSFERYSMSCFIKMYGSHQLEKDVSLTERLTTPRTNTPFASWVLPNSVVLSRTQWKDQCWSDCSKKMFYLDFLKVFDIICDHIPASLLPLFTLSLKFDIYIFSITQLVD